MRALIIIQATLLIAALAAPNYANNSAVCNAAPAEQSLALVITNSTICGHYEGFEISMSDIKGAVPQEDAERGSFVVNYPGAKFQINGNSYTSKVLTFRHQSEHSLTGNRTALEMQIEMDNDEAGKPPGVLSFLVEDLGEDPTDVRKIEPNRLYAKSKVVESLNPESWTINLNQLGQRLQGKADQDQYLNLYSYPGTFNYPPCQQATWYIYGTPIYAPTSEVNNFRDLVKTATTFTPGDDSSVNSAQVMTTTTTDINDNPLLQKFCYSGYFSVTIGYSYGLWFAIASILIFFITVLYLGEKPIKNPRYQENVWTHHPIYSIKNYGNDLHTRKSRVLLLLVLVSLNACFSGVFYHQSHNRSNDTNIIVYAIYASLISFVITFLIGNALRRYYLAKAEFIQTKDEEIEQRAQNRLFLYYILIFVVVIVAWPVTVWMLNDIYNQSPISVSNLWVASFFVGIALELLIYYPLECVIAKSSEGFRNLIKRRGFMYDNLNHETWMAYYKSL